MSLEHLYELLDKHHANQNKELQGVLGQVRRFLNLSDEGFDMHKLREALTYLGSLPIHYKPFLSDPVRKPLISFLEEDSGKQEVFDTDFLKQMRREQRVFSPQQSFSEKERLILKELYAAISSVYRAPAWVHEYAPEEFQDWQQKVRDSKARNAMLDFKRDLAVYGKAGGSDEEITARLDRLIDEAYAYPAESKATLRQWLLQKGDQALAGDLFVKLFGDNHFSDDNVVVNPGIMQSVYSWTVEHGKIVMNFDTVMASAMVADKFLFIKKDGVSQGEAVDPPEVEMMWYQSLKDSQQTIPKLMEFKGRIALAIDQDGHVDAHMVEAKVASYSKDLLSPARFHLSSPRPTNSA